MVVWGMGLSRCRLIIYLMVVVGVAIGDDCHVFIVGYTFMLYISFFDYLLRLINHFNRLKKVPDHPTRTSISKQTALHTDIDLISFSG